MENCEYFIVGAGIAGLTLAERLATEGKSVIIIERENHPGGLARSFNYNKFIFDTGPKRFFTTDKKVNKYLEFILPQGYFTITRDSQIYFYNKFLRWPMTVTEAFNLPLNFLVKCTYDLLQKQKFEDISTYKNYIISNYGKTLYKEFFAPYTRKFLHLPPEKIHSHWATSGIDRAVIDKRTKVNSLFELLKSLIRKAPETYFLYPKNYGFGGFIKRQVELIKTSAPAQLKCDIEIKKIIIKPEEIIIKTNQNNSISAKRLIWSGNINDLLKLLEIKGLSFPYIHTIFINIELNEKPKHSAQWIYIPAADKLLSRLSFPLHFASYVCPQNKWSLTGEITVDSEKHPFWSEPTYLTERIKKELLMMNIINSPTAIENIYFEKVRDTYPVYHSFYDQEWTKCLNLLKVQYPRITLLGRSGCFWYNNADHSIRMALELAEAFINNTKFTFNPREYFA